MVDEARQRIEKELQSVMDRLTQLGGAVVIEDLPGPVGANNPFADLAEKVQVCEECGDTISPARLRALPEVTTCVRCQDRQERSARQLAQADMALLKTMRKRNRRVQRAESL